VLKIYNGEKTASSTNVARKSGYLPAKKLKLDLCLLPCTSINSKWIKDLDIRPETLKLVQEGAENSLEVIGIGKEFLNSTPTAQQLKEKMNKWDFIKLESFCTIKKNGLLTEETTHRVGENISSYPSDKGLITRIYRDLKKLNSPKINEPIKKWANELNRTFSKQ
jgi:hypothetical protein